MTERKRLRIVGAWVLCFSLLAALVGCGGPGKRRPAAGDSQVAATCAIQPIPSPAYGTTFVAYQLFDSPESAVDVVAEFSSDSGVSWLPATQGFGGDGLEGLIATPEGSSFVFAWDLVTDFPEGAVRNFPDVVLRLSSGETCLSEPVTVRGSPNRLQVGSTGTGLDQDIHIPISLTSGQATGTNTYLLDLELIFDTSILDVQRASLGAAAQGAMLTFTEQAPGRAMIRLESPIVALEEGVIVVLEATSTCAVLQLPALTEIECAEVSGADALNNAVSIICGQPGAITVSDNSATISVDDGILSEGAVGGIVRLSHVTGQPAMPAVSLEASLSWDPAALDITGGSLGPAADAAGTVQLIPGAAGNAILRVQNPSDVPFVSGVVAELLADVLAPAGTVVRIGVDQLRLDSERCTGLRAILDPEGEITVVGQRTLVSLAAVSSLGARGTPAQVTAGAPRNPKGDWFPLNTGQFNPVASLPAGGNPIIFFSNSDPGFQIALEANWSQPAAVTDVAGAASADGSTLYSVLSGAGNILVSPDGMLTPVVGNSCSVFRAMFSPNLMAGFGSPASVDFAACVDLGGIDAATRAGAGAMEVGGLDADLPGMPLGDPVPGVGGTFDTTVYASSGGLPMGDYEVRTIWDAAILTLDAAAGMSGYLPPSDAALGGPDAVEDSIPGESIASRVVATPGYSGIFDIWTLRHRAIGTGLTQLTNQVIRMNSFDVPPIQIGAPAPRLALQASTPLIEIP